MRSLGAALLEAHPTPTLLLDAGQRILVANEAARRSLGAREGARLDEAIRCLDPRREGACGTGTGTGLRCASCAFRKAAARALAGERVRERGFVLHGNGGSGAPSDLHLIAHAVPFDDGGEPRALLTLDDANAILGDPRLVRICDGCGRVQDEEGGWHPLHVFFEDRLGLEPPGVLCDACEAGARARSGD